VTRSLAVPTAVLLLAGTAACGADDVGGGPEEGGPTTLTVYAAASLTSSFEKLGEDFERDHDGVQVELTFAGSSDLVSQIQNGAPADVFASADKSNMDKLTADGLNGSDPEPFATNTLEIAVPPDNPADIASLQDLATPSLALVTCAPEVPCGAAAQAVAEVAGVTLKPVSEEQSVTDVLAKVSAGEADAGLVYVTDVIAAGDDVRGIEFPESRSVVNVYPIATVADRPNEKLAQAFVDLVLSDDGQQVLADAGFGRP
jgi:molybdate transport system substrate-binding protein